MPELTTPRELFLHELGDILYVERKLTDEVLPKLIAEVSDEEFRGGLESHLEQTRQHVANVEQVFSIFREKPKAERCLGFEGLKSEHDQLVEESSSSLIDIVDVGAAARTENYEIAAYEGLRRMAKALGEDEAVDLLDQNLKQEKETLREVEKSRLVSATRAPSSLPRRRSTKLGGASGREDRGAPKDTWRSAEELSVVSVPVAVGQRSPDECREHVPWRSQCANDSGSVEDVVDEVGVEVDDTSGRRPEHLLAVEAVPALRAQSAEVDGSRSVMSSTQMPEAQGGAAAADPVKKVRKASATSAGRSSGRKWPASNGNPRTSSAQRRQVPRTSNHRPSSSWPAHKASTGQWILRPAAKSASSSS